MSAMDRTEIEELFDLRGQTVVDSDGEKIGKIEQVYVDPDNEEPEWMVVKTGLLGSKSRFVPFRATERRGDDVVVPYTKEQVKDAPEFEPETATHDDEVALYRHYGQPLKADRPPTVRNPFARSQPIWAPTARPGWGEEDDAGIGAR